MEGFLLESLSCLLISLRTSVLAPSLSSGRNPFFVNCYQSAKVAFCSRATNQVRFFSNELLCKANLGRARLSTGRTAERVLSLSNLVHKCSSLANTQQTQARAGSGQLFCLDIGLSDYVYPLAPTAQKCSPELVFKPTVLVIECSTGLARNTICLEMAGLKGSKRSRGSDGRA